jgi:hypothetical protein
VVGGVLWVLVGAWIFLATPGWQDRPLRHRNRVIIAAHLCLVLPLLVIAADAGGPGLSGDEVPVPSERPKDGERAEDER